MIVTALSYQQRVEVGQARGPFASEAFVLEQNLAAINGAAPSVAPAFRFGGRSDTLSDGFQFDLVIVTDARVDAAPPPGLGRWPEPGEVLLSPALARDGASESIGTRYGTLVGLIGEDGLSAPDERFAYVNPRPGTFPQQSLNPAERFGAPTQAAWYSASLPSVGESGYIFPAAFMLGAIVCLALAPAVVLSGVARSAGSEQRRRRLLTYRVLGASPLLLRWARFGDVAGPFVVAVCSGFGFWWLLTTVRIVVPVTQFELPLHQLQTHSALVVGAVLVSLAVGLAILMTEPVSQRGEATTPRPADPKIPKWSYVVSPSAYVAAIWVPSWLDPAGRTVWQLTYFTLVLIGLVGLPFLLNTVVLVASRALVRSARSHGSPSLLLSGRMLSAHPSTTVALMATICVATGLLFQGLFLSNAMQQLARQAIQISATLDGRVAVADFTYGVRTLPAIRSALAGRAELAVLTFSNDSAQLTADCAALTALEMPCRSGPTSTASEFLTFATAPNAIRTYEVAVSAAEAGARMGTDQRLVIVSSGPLDMPAVKSAVIQNGWPNTSPSSPVFGFAGSALATAHQSLWLVVFGSLGIVTLVGAITLVNLTEFRRRARELAPLAAITGSRRPFVLVPAVVLFAPLMLAGLGGVGLAITIAQVPISIGLAPPYGGSALVAIVFIVTTVALVSAAAGCRMAMQAARTWRPGDAG